MKLVVDDGSTDNTPDIIKLIRDKRFFYYYKENEERAAARNYGVCKAKGDYITYLDSDDILLPHFLLEAISLVQKQNNPPWFHLKYKINKCFG